MLFDFPVKIYSVLLCKHSFCCSIELSFWNLPDRFDLNASDIFTRVQFLEDLVIATPDIIQVSLGSDAEFVLLASDGLWDYMSRSAGPLFHFWRSVCYIFSQHSLEKWLN